MKRRIFSWMLLGVIAFAAWNVVPSVLIPTASAQDAQTIDIASFAARLDTVTQWPLDQGLATFSARLTSPTIETLCRNQGVPEPELTLDYLGWELVEVETRIATATPVAMRGVLGTLTESVRNTVEGFFQNYETLALRNPLHGISASATCRFEQGKWTVQYPDRSPGQIVTLEFDDQLMMTSLVAHDSGKGVSIRQRPTWTRIGERWVLTGTVTEFFKNGVSVFLSTTTIENVSTAPFHLPERVRLEVRDGPVEQASRALIEFRCADYRLGLARR